jgi:filamentous hemagglutinin family protein
MRLRWRAGGGASLGGLLLAFPLTLAAPATPQVRTDGSLGPRMQVPGPDHVIGHDLGQVRGQNLFHSFRKFNVPTGGSATFTGPSAVENIVVRVTGGSASSISGALRSDIAGVNLFLMNPAGVLFGSGAFLEIGGSFHASTASELRLADGQVFAARRVSLPGLMVAPPAAFGFVRPGTAPIRVEGAVLVRARTTRSLSLSGRAIAVDGALVMNDPLGAPGEIRLTNPGSDGTVPLLDAAVAPATSTPRQGTIRLDAAAILVATGEGGRIAIRAGDFIARRSALIVTSQGDRGRGTVDVQASGALTGRRLTAKVETKGFFNPDIGDIRLDGDRVTLSRPALLAVGRGSGGNVTIVAGRSLAVSGGGGSGIETSSRAATGGAVTMQSGGALVFLAAIRADGFTGGGDVTVTARGSIRFDGFLAANGVLGIPGDVTFHAGRALRVDGTIVTGSGSDVQSTIDLTAGDGLIVGARISGVSGGRDIEARGADVLMRAKRVYLADAEITVQGRSGMNRSIGGNIVIAGDDLVVVEGTTLSASSLGTGGRTEAGNVSIGPTTAVLVRDSVLDANAVAGGTILIRSGSLFIVDSVLEARGEGGQVALQAPLMNSDAQATPPKALTLATPLVAARCSARGTPGRTSTFVQHGRDVRPSQPDEWLAGPVLEPARVVDGALPGRGLGARVEPSEAIGVRLVAAAPPGGFGFGAAPRQEECGR